MINNTRTIIEIRMQNVDQANRLTKVLQDIQEEGLKGGDLIINGKSIGHDVNIKKVTHKTLDGEELNGREGYCGCD